MRGTIRHWRPLVLFALLGTWILLSGCTSDSVMETVSPIATPAQDANKSSDVVASIGGVTITREELTNRILADYGAQTLRTVMLAEAVRLEAEALRLKVTEDELQLELLSMRQGYEDERQFYAAMKEQLGMSAEQVKEDARYRLLLEKIAIHKVIVTDREIDRYLDEHREEYEPRKQYRLAQILVKDDAEAESILSQLSGGADFGALARRYSLDEFTADNGGDLGWVEDQDPFEAPEVLRTASSMEVGQVTGPVQTGQGYVILQLNGINEVTAKLLKRFGQK
ncbi:hypothetical protein SD71_16610 [Cohnella kolymensis]|uniref:peptidylprolyl isomerase n=1 Tax=Cohnella kolymensis TaxID=1590652 RepID=A0ABR5A1V2_9BACL|nr:peptidyl-prolyl cis-trans isomerase [Cohnella kolymensis]KIL34970.1 hypothetical protein SD71_16610 [Cohnella kolymensis]